MKNKREKSVEVQVWLIYSTRSTAEISFKWPIICWDVIRVQKNSKQSVTVSRLIDSKQMVYRRVYCEHVEDEQYVVLKWYYSGDFRVDCDF